MLIKKNAPFKNTAVLSKINAKVYKMYYYKPPVTLGAPNVFFLARWIHSHPTQRDCTLTNYLDTILTCHMLIMFTNLIKINMSTDMSTCHKIFVTFYHK